MVKIVSKLMYILQIKFIPYIVQFFTSYKVDKKGHHSDKSNEWKCKYSLLKIIIEN